MSTEPRPAQSDDEQRRIVGDGVRRAVGIAALRRLHRMIDEEKQAAARDARFVRVAGLVIALAAAATVLWLALQ